MNAVGENADLVRKGKPTGVSLAVRLHRAGALFIVRGRSERSAARLAHQSGGLGVPSSNLGAPTNKTPDFIEFLGGRRASAHEQKSIKNRQKIPNLDKKART